MSKYLLHTVVTVSVGLALIAFPAWADEGQAPGAPHGDHGNVSVKADVPDDIKEILITIDAKQIELHKAVSEKRLSDVHQFAFAIRDLAKPLLDKVSTDKRAKVEGTVNNIAKLATDLDTSGDAGDQAKTEANMKKLDGTLKLLEAQVAPK